MGSQIVGHDWATEVDRTELTTDTHFRTRISTLETEWLPPLFPQIPWRSGQRCFSLSQTWWLRSKGWTSLVIQWLRIPLPRQGAQVRSLVREDLTGHEAGKPTRHSHWACALQQEKPLSWEAWAPNREQPCLTAVRESPCEAVKTQCSET